MIVIQKYDGWKGFESGTWTKEINVRSFIKHNFTPYDGNEAFLVGPTKATLDLWDQVMELTKQEREAGGVLDMDTRVISTITSHGPGYLNKELEKIVGLQTDKPLKRALMPYGGIRMAEKACKDNGYEIDPEIKEFFTTHRKTHFGMLICFTICISISFVEGILISCQKGLSAII